MADMAVSSDTNTIIIPEMFRGPPRSGNGGYVAGRFAAFIDPMGPVEVTLRAPIPLDSEMQVKHYPDGSVVISKDDTLIAEAQSAALEIEVPEPPSWEETEAAEPGSFSYLERVNALIPGGKGLHPICFCCGVEHPEGARVFAAPVNDGQQVAAVWPTQESWADADGMLLPEMLWTALDCPGQFAFLADDVFTGMLGRLTTEIYLPVKAGESFLVTGWRIGTEGKKNFAGTAVFNRDNQLVAAAKAVWIGRRDFSPLNPAADQ